jgi:hypothetical protein
MPSVLFMASKIPDSYRGGPEHSYPIVGHGFAARCVSRSEPAVEGGGLLGDVISFALVPILKQLSSGVSTGSSGGLPRF